MKNHPLIKVILIGWGIFLSFSCYAQSDYPDIPLAAMPMLYNGSFAGETGETRVSSFSSFTRRTGLSWPHNKQVISLYNSFDHFIPAIGTGIGITAGYDETTARDFSGEAYFLSVAFAPKLSIKGKYTLSPSLDFSHYSGKASFQDYPRLNNFRELAVNEQTSSKAGLLFNTNKYYIGYAVFLVKHLNQVNRDGEKYSGPGKNFKSFLQFGYTYQRTSESKFSITPQFMFKIDEKTHEFDRVINLDGINITFRYKNFIWGGNETGILLGLQTRRLKLMVSSMASEVSTHPTPARSLFDISLNE